MHTQKISTRIILFAATTCLLLLLAGCENRNESAQQAEQSSETKLKVAASFYPLAELAQRVGGQSIELFTVTPPGAEPHDYEPTPRDMVTIQEANVIILNGAGQDPWADRVAEELRAAGKTVIMMSEEMEFMENTEDEEHEEEEGHDEDEEEHEFDPHVWLDPLLYAEEAEIIAGALAQADPQNAQTYQQNATDYSAELAQLHQEYQSGLATCQRNNFITSHTAFSYLARRYNLTQVGIAGLSPDAEPSAKRLAELTDFARENGATTIFFETLVSPKLAQTLADEVGAQAKVLNPIEGLTPEQLSEGKNYTILMRENLEALKAALNCEEAL